MPNNFPLGVNKKPARRFTTPVETTPGFACKINEETQLGIAAVIAEYDAGGYVPVGFCSCVSEGRGMVANWMETRIKEFRMPAGVTFKIWAHGVNGEFAVAAEWSSWDSVVPGGRKQI